MKRQERSAVTHIAGRNSTNTVLSERSQTQNHIKENIVYFYMKDFLKRDQTNL